VAQGLGEEGRAAAGSKEKGKKTNAAWTPEKKGQQKGGETWGNRKRHVQNLKGRNGGREKRRKKAAVGDPWG